MKFICDRLALLEGLSAASAVATARSTKPILQCVRITGTKNLVTLTAYDQEVGLRYHIRQVDVTKPGETLVSCERLLAIVRESADETMSFESDEDTLHIRGADSHFTVIGQSVREFPPVPDLEGDADFSVKVAPLRDAVEHTLFAAARENTRYAINGVLWQKKGKTLQLVATDGRRLAMSAASLEKSVGDDLQAIVPAKALALLGRLHFGGDEVMNVKISANQVHMRTEQAELSSVLVEGHFPKYEDVIPRDNDKKITLKTDEFLSAVRRSAVLSTVDSKGIRIAIGPEGMVISGKAHEQGEAVVKLSGIEYTGSPITIGFNPEFLQDALKVCGENLTLELKEPARPGLIRSGPVYQYVVMPVSLT